MSIVDNKNVEDRYVIQILRAIAICLVVFHHSVNALNLPEYMNVSVQIINKIHVNIFFVISGFLFEKKKNTICGIGNYGSDRRTDLHFLRSKNKCVVYLAVGRCPFLYQNQKRRCKKKEKRV